MFNAHELFAREYNIPTVKKLIRISPSFALKGLWFAKIMIYLLALVLRMSKLQRSTHGEITIGIFSREFLLGTESVTLSTIKREYLQWLDLPLLERQNRGYNCKLLKIKYLSGGESGIRPTINFASY